MPTAIAATLQPRLLIATCETWMRKRRRLELAETRRKRSVSCAVARAAHSAADRERTNNMESGGQGNQTRTIEKSQVEEVPATKQAKQESVAVDLQRHSQKDNDPLARPL